MAIYMNSERLWFRAPMGADAAVLTGFLHDPRVRRNLAIGRYPFSEEGEARWLAEQDHPPAMDGQTDVRFAFGAQGQEQVLGVTGLHRISMLHRNAEWGILIGRPEEWGKGYGREVARAMLAYAFRTLNLHRVWLRVNADHPGGIKAYEAAGFRREGVFRQHIFVDGTWVDQVAMAALATEWK
ncbi:MAG: GNAT family N-acetyltransferase [Planctomycetes bacterium]|nr:GNAT family N-acetyltransferase [Planctomycetota bacterium]